MTDDNILQKDNHSELKMAQDQDQEYGGASDERGLLDQIEVADSENFMVDDFEEAHKRLVKAAITIQRQARVMISRNNFRVCLYKLILLKNIVETKMHKEKMQLLFAFEQFIINTEEYQDEDAEEYLKNLKSQSPD